ncbi:hypothetical protein NA57DRAFT_51635 [Rhizodiscina lignyota]|uniref:Uncharacterized protein n=1 Tax=Rhizodiscina lignyota TaxID=1504668 RepID=A0A9P4IV30_9PEZI|nr:hypothetical protein NA57DRAFT_51635 [Rhizodiscina lignyota]
MQPLTLLTLAAATLASALPNKRDTTSTFDPGYIYYQMKPEGAVFLSAHGGTLAQYPQWCETNGKNCVMFHPKNPDPRILKDKNLSLFLEHVHHTGYDQPRLHSQKYSKHCLKDLNAKAKCEVEYEYGYNESQATYDPTKDQLYDIVQGEGWVIGIIAWAGKTVTSVKCIAGDGNNLRVITTTDKNHLKNAAKLDLSGIGCNWYQRILSQS